MNETGFFIIIALMVTGMFVAIIFLPNKRNTQTPVPVVQPVAEPSSFTVQPVAPIDTIGDIIKNQNIPATASTPVAYTYDENKNIAFPDNNPIFQVKYISIDTKTNIHFAVAVDTQTGVEYVIIRDEQGGITVTPRFHKDIPQEVEKK
jgi:hypothetical protein